MPRAPLDPIRTDRIPDSLRYVVASAEKDEDYEIVAHDTADNIPDGYVGIAVEASGAGLVEVTTDTGEDVPVRVPANQLRPIKHVRIRTGSTAGGIVTWIRKVN